MTTIVERILNRATDLLRLSQMRALSSSSQLRSSKKNLYGLNFDRRIKVDYLDSIKYMESTAYEKTYLGLPVWKLYRRNHKDQLPSEGTRQNCINSEGFLMTSHPCVICRDEYLVLHHENSKLIQQFIDPFTGKILPRTLHGLCRKQYRNLLIAVMRAKDFGTIYSDVPERLYDYENYYRDV